jgi:hypothetical protein
MTRSVGVGRTPLPSPVAADSSTRAHRCVETISKTIVGTQTYGSDGRSSCEYRTASFVALMAVKKCTVVNLPYGIHSFLSTTDPSEDEKPRDRRTLPRRIKTDRASKKSAEDDADACVLVWDLQPCSTVVRKDHVHVRAGIRSSMLGWQRSSLHRTRTAGGRRRDEDGRKGDGRKTGSQRRGMHRIPQLFADAQFLGRRSTRMFPWMCECCCCWSLLLLFGCFSAITRTHVRGRPTRSLRCTPGLIFQRSQWVMRTNPYASTCAG